MSNGKRAWHEHASDELLTASQEVEKTPLLNGPIAVVTVLLKMLRDCQMPPKEARRIGEVHVRLPEIMGKTGREECVALAQETLKDLGGCEDEKVEMPVPTPIAFDTGYEHINPREVFGN